MHWPWLCAMVIVAYLSGSVNYAIIVTRLRTGQDIRTMGNGNPGTANVSRTLGNGWGALVLLLDVLKGLGPMLLARLLFFSTAAPGDVLAVFATGIAAIVGHCRPVYYRFRGGGGMATSLPVFFFFVPVEFGATLILSALVVVLFVRRVRFRVGRWIPILFAALAPFLTLATNWIPAVPLAGQVTIGGHPWSVLVGVFAVSLTILALDFPVLVESLRNLREGVGDDGKHSGGLEE